MSMRISDVLNQAALMDRIDHDVEFLADTVELYNKDRSELVSQMREAVSRQDSGALANAAHTLSGLACSFSAQPVVYAALKLQIMAEKGELSGADEALAALEDETHRLQTALQGILHQRRKTDVPQRRQRTQLPMAKHRIRVITIDDQEITRNGIRFMLLACDDIELVGEAQNGAEGLRLCSKLKPDVVLMDVKMPKMNGVEATRAIRQKHPDTQVLVLTAYHGNELVKETMKVGAIGYVMKDVSRDELAEAIREARAGRTTLSPEAATDLLAEAPTPSIPPGGELTDREHEVLVLLVKGMRNSQIAKELNRSPYTVRHHVSEIIAKLGAANRAEAAALAVQHKLVE